MTGTAKKKPRTVVVPFDPSKGLAGFRRFSRTAAKLRDTGKADHIALPVGTVAALQEFIENIADGALSRARAGEPNIPHDVAMAILGSTHPVRAWRKYKRLTLRDVAAKSAVPVGYLSEIETGKKPGSVDAYKALAKAMDLDIALLIPD